MGNVKSGGEAGIRTLQRPCPSLTYRNHIAQITINATHAADHCTLLPAGLWMVLRKTGRHKCISPEGNPIYLRVNESLDIG